MNNIYLFLEKYKGVESCLRAQQIDMKSYEESLPEADSQKLRMCRNLRNYAAHNDGFRTFLSISDEMIKFLDKIDKDVKKNISTVKEYMDKSCVVSHNTTFAEASKTLNKSNILVVVDDKKQYLGFFTNKQLRKMIADNKTTKTAKIKPYIIPVKKTPVISPDTLLESVPSSLCIVQRERDNVVLGLIKDTEIYNQNSEF